MAAVPSVPTRNEPTINVGISVGALGDGFELSLVWVKPNGSPAFHRECVGKHDAVRRIEILTTALLEFVSFGTLPGEPS